MRLLSTNFRNACEISDIALVVRNHYMKRTEFVPSIISNQAESGHLIRGTKPRLLVFKEENLWPELLKNELVNLNNQFCTILKPSKEIVILRSFGLQLYELGISNVVSELGYWDENEVKMMIKDPADNHSVEWPVVIAMMKLDIYSSAAHYLDWPNFLSVLYTAISRATVHCSVLMYITKSNNEETGCCLKDLLSDIESISPGSVQYVEHDDLSFE